MKITKSVFEIAKMDCSAEEQMIRLKLSEEAVRAMTFDLRNRKLTVYHHGAVNRIHSKIRELELGDSLLESGETVRELFNDSSNDARLLWYVLLINAFCFILEITTGIISKSMGLVADSLDMLADAFVYALSLYAVGKVAAKKKQVAKVSGYLQLILAVIGFAEVVRRFLGFESLPEFRLMIIVSVIALLGNVASLLLLQKSKSSEAHIKASLIFTSNDIIINFGVITAGVLVLLTGSNKPDLIVGSVVFLIIIRGAIRILKLSK